MKTRKDFRTSAEWSEWFVEQCANLRCDVPEQRVESLAEVVSIETARQRRASR